MDRGLVSKSDESALARRRFKDLIGPSGIALMTQWIALGEKKCWRDFLFKKQQAMLSQEAMTRSLNKLRKECWKARVETRYRLSPHQYWDLVRQTRIRSKMTRARA